MNLSRDMSIPGLYVHIPFCRSKCPYCGFFSVTATDLIPRWLDALEKEIILYEGRFNRFDSLYLGGGTPTILDTGALAGLVDRLFFYFDFCPDSEMTIEANPCDLTKEKIRALKSMGFNRVSLGIQSLDDDVLIFLGRKHTARQAENAFRALRYVGFENISVDLIYGIPGQSKDRWMKTLNRAVALQPEHLSCYQLTMEKKTLFWAMMKKGRFRPLGEEEEKACFLLNSEFLERNGYLHYEISSFARDRAWFSRHNRKYWAHTPYLGLGPSAHSFHPPLRWWNVRSVRRYIDMLAEGRSSVEGSENLSAEQLTFETVFLGLRTTDGFSQDVLAHDHRMGEALSRLKSSGFVTVDNGRVIPTRKGFLVADSLAGTLGLVQNIDERIDL